MLNGCTVITENLSVFRCIQIDPIRYIGDAVQQLYPVPFCGPCGLLVCFITPGHTVIVPFYMEGVWEVGIIGVLADSKDIALGHSVIPHAACASSCVIRSLARRAYSSVTSMPVAV